MILMDMIYPILLYIIIIIIIIRICRFFHENFLFPINNLLLNTPFDKSARTIYIRKENLKGGDSTYSPGIYIEWGRPF